MAEEVKKIPDIVEKLAAEAVGEQPGKLAYWEEAILPFGTMRAAMLRCYEAGKEAGKCQDRT